MIKQKIILAMIFGVIFSIKSQTNTVDEQLQKKYWDYRQRFQKHFIAYDNTVNGSGLSINHLNTFSEGGTENISDVNIPFYTDAGGRRGIIKEADGPEQLALFFATLALEYRILKDEGKSTKAVLNEIYYGIQALNRLDDKAEPFLSNNSSAPNRNGFLMRSDADYQLVDHFNNEYLNTSDKKDNIRTIRNDNWDAFTNSVTADRKANTMSKDHVMDILEGFLFLKKFVDNEIIQPTPQEPVITLHNEIIAITNRILNYVTQVRQTTQTQLPNIKTIKKGLCTDNEIRYYTNWIIFDEINSNPVYRGNNFNLFAYPIALAAKKVSGYPWDSHPIKLKIDGTLCSDWKYTALNVDLNIGSPTDIMPSTWHNLENQFTDLYTAMSNTINTEVCINVPPIAQFLGIGNNQICIHPQEVEDFVNGVITKTDPVQLLLTLATISNTWSHANIVAAGDSRFFYHYDLMYSLLNNDNPIHNKQFFENILNTAPCEGPFNFDYPNLNNGQITWDPIWHHNNRWVHPTDLSNQFGSITTSREEQGYFHGLDYMFLYNMYRYYYRNQINLPYSDNNTCLCNEKGKIYNSTDLATHTILESNVVIKRKFNNYKNINIFTKEYISNNLNIPINKKLTNATDLIICNNSILTIENLGVLENQTTPNANDSIKVVSRPGTKINIDADGLLDIKTNTKVVMQNNSSLILNGINSKIIVRNGGKLIVEAGAFLELNNGSKLIVEDGGQVIIQTNLNNPNASVNGVLTFNQGAAIQLKGNNAVLEINGRLHIGDNATFGFTYPGSNSGYIKFNRGAGIWWDNWATNNAHITCGVNSKISLIGQNKTDKIIAINQINVAIPKNLSSFVVSKGLIEFNVGDARLETAITTVISNSTFKGNYMATGNNTDYTRGLWMFGQQTFLVIGCDFKTLGTGVGGALFYGGKKLSGVKNCNFQSCGIGIYTIGAGVSVLNNNFIDVGSSIFSTDAVSNSFISNNTITTSSPPFTADGLGIGAEGPNVQFEISKNTINNMTYGLYASNSEMKLRCNDLQNNQYGIFAATNSKFNMNSTLGGGYNNANNCDRFAWFYEAGSFEANDGYNNFKITNSAPCYIVPALDHHPFTPAYEVCPTIMEGSLINFTNFDTTTSKYEIIAEQNFWRTLGPLPDAVEDRQNKIRRIDLTDPYFPILDSASIVTGNVLTNTSLVTCPPNGGSSGCVGLGCRTFVHPLDPNSNSATITTASFYNKKLQKALEFSLNKMDKMQNVNKVNNAADLFTEILKANYITPVKTTVDKYLLELAYQKLFTCVAQLTEWHKDSVLTFNPIPSSLQSRYNDLHTICALRAGRKDITEIDYKEISDLILLDKASIYRLSEDRINAIAIVNNIIATSPKAQHLNMYEKFRCLWSSENDALNGTISFDEAIGQIDKCSKQYNTLPISNNNVSSRKINPKKTSDVIYSYDYAIAVFPNPTNGSLSVAYNLVEFNKIALEIFDAQGKKMSSYNLNPEDKIINIENLDLGNGVYFYTIKGDEKTLMTKKLVVVK